MSSVNKVILIGNVGQDPEIKKTVNGVSYVRLSLATTETWRDKTTGEKKELTTWHNLKFYDQLAKTCVDFLKKGKKVYVEGSLRIGEYEKDGIKHKSVEVLCKHLVLLGEQSNNEARWGADVGVKKSSSLNPQRPIDKLVHFDPKVNPLRNIESAPFDNDHNDIPF